jgi:hypothetical protein
MPRPSRLHLVARWCLFVLGLVAADAPLLHAAVHLLHAEEQESVRSAAAVHVEAPDHDDDHHGVLHPASWHERDAVPPLPDLAIPYLAAERIGVAFEDTIVVRCAAAVPSVPQSRPPPCPGLPRAPPHA